MMDIAIGFSKIKKKLDRYRQYSGHEIYSQCTRLSQPIWLHMDGVYLKLDGSKKMELACELVAIYHNQNAYVRVEEENYSCYVPAVTFPFPPEKSQLDSQSSDR